MRPLVGRAGARALWMSTFHSFGLRFVQRGAQDARAARAASSIFDQGDALGVVKDILRELRRAAPRASSTRTRSSRASRAGRTRCSRRRQVPESDFEYDDVAREVYPEYEARLRAMCALDFDDLVRACRCACSRGTPTCASAGSARFDHVLVDEFQDTNKVQLELIKLLRERSAATSAWSATTTSRSTAGAAPTSRNILDFERHFPGATHRQARGQLPLARSAILDGGQRGDRARAAAGATTRRCARRAARGDKVRLCVCDDPATKRSSWRARSRDLLQDRQRARRHRRALPLEPAGARDRRGAARRGHRRTACSAARSSSIAARSRTSRRICACCSTRATRSRCGGSSTSRRAASAPRPWRASRRTRSRAATSFCAAMRDVQAIVRVARRGPALGRGVHGAHDRSTASGCSRAKRLRRRGARAGRRRRHREHLMRRRRGRRQRRRSAGPTSSTCFGWLERSSARRVATKAARCSFLERVTLTTSSDNDEAGRRRDACRRCTAPRGSSSTSCS